MEIGALEGVLELRDEFSSTLGLAEAALSQFSEHTQESMTAVAEAGGLVAAAFIAMGAAVIELGKRGADVTNVENTLEHFAGGAAEANDIMERLKKTTLGTVEEFDLAKTSAHLLSAGVKLTAEDFSTLGAAAELLHKRGLGPTADQMELVSRALVTGRTRALTMAIGVIDLKGAEEKYAEALGVTKDALTTEQVAEAKRIGILEALRQKVKEAGEQHRDFGEQIKAGQVAILNWVDDLGQAVAASPALSAGMKAIGVAMNDAFGGNNKESIKTILEYIKSGVIYATDFGLATIEMARVINIAWSGIKVVVLATEGVIASIGAGIADVISVVVNAAANLPGATAGMKQMAAQMKEVSVQGHAMADSLADQAAEASKGLHGDSELDKTLDKLGGTLFNVRDAVISANASMADSNGVVDIAAKNARTMAKLNDEWAAAVDARAKSDAEAAKLEAKYATELTHAWDDYFAELKLNSGTSMDVQKQKIEEWFDLAVSKIDDMATNWDEQYSAIEAQAGEKLKGVEMDWNSVRDKSIESLQQTADKALATYDAMCNSSLHFTREVLDEQLAKVHAATDAANGMGQAAVLAQNAAADAAKKHTSELQAQADKMKELQRINREMGGSRTYDLSTKEGMAEFQKLNPMATMSGAAAGTEYYKTHTIEDAIKAGLMNLYGKWTGPRMAGGGLSGGGMTMVGENGPELVNLPGGARVYPSGTGPGGAGAGAHITNNFYVNGTAADVARKVSDHIMRTLKSQHQFGAA